MSSNPKRHVGRLRNTDRRCVVVFMQIPNDEGNALIVDTDGLPDYIHESLFLVVDSTSAQCDTNLSDVLCRRTSPEPSQDMLSFLHTRGLLTRMPITNVVMYPLPNQPVPLEQIIEFMGGTVPQKSAPHEQDLTEKFNPILDNQRMDGVQKSLSLATGKLREAELLESEAKKKREEAYGLFPQLRPGYVEPTIKQPQVRQPESITPHLNPYAPQPQVQPQPVRPIMEEVNDIPEEYQELLRREQEKLDSFKTQGDIVKEEEVIVQEEVKPKKRGRKKAS